MFQIAFFSVFFCSSLLRPNNFFFFQVVTRQLNLISTSAKRLVQLSAAKFPNLSVAKPGYLTLDEIRQLSLVPPLMDGDTIPSNLSPVPTPDELIKRLQ